MNHTYATYRDGQYVTVPPIDELCLALKEKFLRQEEDLERLRQENKNLKSGVWAENEMARLKAENEELREQERYSFTITKAESEAIRQWKERHDKERHGADTFNKRLRLEGVSGGRHTYIFVPTAIGTSGCVRCSCGESFCFRDIG